MLVWTTKVRIFNKKRKKIWLSQKKSLNLQSQTRGKMPERSIGTVSKTVVPLRVPRVRIPVFPHIEGHEQPLLVTLIFI